MTAIAKLSSPLEATFSVLKSRRFVASIDVLLHGLQSESDVIRTTSLQTLLSRGGPEECRGILSRIEYCSDDQVKMLESHLSLISDPIEYGLYDSDSEVRRRAWIAISKLRIGGMYHHLVAAASSTLDEHQMFAVELILKLSHQLGQLARSTARREDSSRQALLEALTNSVANFHEHRVEEIVDAWLSCVHWDDEIFCKIMVDPQMLQLNKVISKQMERSKRQDVMEFLAGLLWARNCNSKVVQLLVNRNDIGLLSSIADFYQKLGPTALLRKNLGIHPELSFLSNLDFANSQISLPHRCALLGLLSLTNVESVEILKSVATLLSFAEPEVDDVLAKILFAMRPVNSDIVVIALSNCLMASDIESYEPPPWKDAMRMATEKLIELYPAKRPVVQSALRQLFSEFSCEEFFEKLEEWPERHLVAYARVARIGCSNYVDFLRNEIQAKSTNRRVRAIKALRIFGLDAALWDLAVEALDDESFQVRIGAIQAIADGHNREDAITVLQPVLADTNLAVMNAAAVALQCLGSMP